MAQLTPVIVASAAARTARVIAHAEVGGVREPARLVLVEQRPGVVLVAVLRPERRVVERDRDVVAVALDLPPLRIDTAFPYEFADPIFRMGNDYSKGIILSTGYVGQRTSNGLVTCLTDGHPGVSGGGVLNQDGSLVGIPIGRMQGDYRFSFILPLRAEMFRKVPGMGAPATPVAEVG